jgi:hypothetical protein
MESTRKRVSRHAAEIALVLVAASACSHRSPARPPPGIYALCIDPTAHPPIAAPLPPCRATDPRFGFRIGASGTFDLIPERLGCAVSFARGGIVLRCPGNAQLSASWRPNADGSVTTDVLDRLEGDADPGPATVRLVSSR